jgi:hypothetical protein
VSAAFAAAVAVALIAILALVLTARRAAAQIAAAHSRVEQLDAQLAETDRARALAAERADGAHRCAADAENRLVAAGTLWDLERIRLEREWAEVAGMPAPLPEPWDGTIRAALAVELEIIREVMGVPGRVESPAAANSDDPIAAVTGFRLTAEVVRSLARVGDEVTVSFGGDGVVTIDLATHGAGPGPDLARPMAAAGALGGELTLLPTDGGFRARLRLPGC